jgi:8-oxo-dGTP diphosphatase
MTIAAKPSHRVYTMPFTRVEIAVLSVVAGRLCVLLGRRTGEPHMGKWALPGGVLRIDLDGTLEDAAQRVMSERLGVGLPFLRQLCAVGGKDRDPRAPWALSVVYRALLPVDSVAATAGKRIEALTWRPVEEATADRKLAFDHAALVERAVDVTREEVRRLELPFGFLPEAFTLTELQVVCEHLLGDRLDKSSFRRRLDALGVVDPIEGEMRGGAYRPAQLYRRRQRR